MCLQDRGLFGIVAPARDGSFEPGDLRTPKIGIVIYIDFCHIFDMPGRWYNKLFTLASDQYGFVTQADVKRLGGSSQVLVDMERRGQVDRYARGIYRFEAFPADPRDELMAAILWTRGIGVISHDSALDLWDICDVNPAKTHMTVPRIARLRKRPVDAYRLHVRDLEAADVTNVDGITVVTPRRAILDGIERHLDNRLIGQATDNARRRGLITAEELGHIYETRK